MRVNTDFPEFRSAEGRDHAIWPYGATASNNGGNDGNVTFRGRNNCTEQRSTGRPGAGCGAVGGNGPLPPEGHTHEFYAAITKVLSCGFKVGSVSQWLIIVSLSHRCHLLVRRCQHRAQTKPTDPLLCTIQMKKGVCSKKHTESASPTSSPSIFPFPARRRRSLLLFLPISLPPSVCSSASEERRGGTIAVIKIG